MQTAEIAVTSDTTAEAIPLVKVQDPERPEIVHRPGAEGGGGLGGVAQVRPVQPGTQMQSHAVPLNCSLSPPGTEHVGGFSALNPIKTAVNVSVRFAFTADCAAACSACAACAACAAASAAPSASVRLELTAACEANWSPTSAERSEIASGGGGEDGGGGMGEGGGLSRGVGGAVSDLGGGGLGLGRGGLGLGGAGFGTAAAVLQSSIAKSSALTGAR